MSKIIGVPVGTPTPRPDWNQNDPSKADYIKNKPDLEKLKITVDSELSETSENPVQNKVITELFNEANEVLTEIGGAVGTLQTGISVLGEKTLPDVTAADNDKILQVKNGKWVKADAPAGGGITVDDALSETSTNPVQNKVLTAEFNAAIEQIGGVLQEMQGAIPTEANINALIDAKLGVIENGTY